MSGEEHQVVGEHPELAFPSAGGIRPGTEGTPEPPLVAAEGGLGLPPLPVHPAVPAPLGLLAEPPDHLAAVAGLGPLAAVRPAVDRDDGGPHPEVLAGVPVVLLAVERGIGQRPV